jgi:hypothetical protein
MSYFEISLTLFLLVVIFSPIELVLHYWAIMNLARVRKLPNIGLSKLASAIGTYFLLRGYFLDIVANVFWGSIILLELPREWTVTARVNRHTREGATGFRTDICNSLQQNILRWFDSKYEDGIHR